MNPETVFIDLGARSYTIHIGQGLLGSLGKIVAGACPAQRALLVTNPTVGRLYGKTVLDQLAGSGVEAVLAEVPDGEEYKALSMAEGLYDLAYSRELDRRSPVLSLGGGVVGDLAGFVAATYLRGVPFVQIPTTLLAQVDSSVGGKVAVNHPRGKNIIGAFYQPAVVLADLGALQTLPPREIRAGLAEVIKYGVIADGEFFGWLEDNLEKALELDPAACQKMVEVSCRIKADIVGADETEQGVRAVLNYGHTVGHAVESLTGYKAYRHGEAVAIGMAVAAEMAVGLGMLDRREKDRLVSLLVRAGLPVNVPGHLDKKDLLASLRRDKKVISSRLTFVLPRAIGRVEIVRDVKEDIIIAGIGD